MLQLNESSSSCVNSNSALMGLPNELLLYILKEFLDLGDLWRLLQVSRAFRYFAVHTIHRRWKIELSPETTMKIQCRAALIALEGLSCQLSTTQTKVSTPTTSFAYSSNPAAASSSFSASAMMDLLEDEDDDDDDDPIDQGTTTTTTTTTTTMMYPQEDEDEDQVMADETGFIHHHHHHHHHSNNNSSSNHHHHRHHHQHQHAAATAAATLNPQRLLLLDDDDDDHHVFDTRINIHQRREQRRGDMMEEESSHHEEEEEEEEEDKHFQQLMRREERLHQRIIAGISSYKHKYVLIEDIDIRNRIRSAVDVVFHHAVFVAAVSRAPVRLACTHASSTNRAQAAMMVRLLTRLDAAFPACCREITFTLADNIKAFLEYTGYKLLAIADKSKGGAVSAEHIYSMVFGPACQSSILCCSSSFNHNNASRRSSSSTSSSSTKKTTQQISQSLLVTLHSISACFDLMGAAFVGKLLSENHIECAVQRTCELLSDPHLRPVKRALLVDLLEGWLTIKRGLVASELCRWVRLEIERCDQQQAAAVATSSSASASSVPFTRQSTTTSLPPLADIFTQLPLA
ncbi:hypothetical protein O0I10_002246 [Lichtheimia ornata]|uniref:F-box domain-containing protein n=1 Tax=Lichtheimia ornata TaxID=688661 RepID=A0AAD7VAJ0_9FUNG|nr:uncharacterized protein O0I10_002246 [Lichtheimia ornata]KAJ8661915.1 hypothetical protein O0I10_002246 [Lichtheimia ornata]